MKQVYPAYHTDNRHSYSSRDLIGIFTSKYKAIAAIKRDIKKQLSWKEYNRILDSLIFHLENYNQTQSVSYDYKGEYVIDCITLNEIV